MLKSGLPCFSCQAADSSWVQIWATASLNVYLIKYLQQPWLGGTEWSCPSIGIPDWECLANELVSPRRVHGINAHVWPSNSHSPFWSEGPCRVVLGNHQPMPVGEEGENLQSALHLNFNIQADFHWRRPIHGQDSGLPDTNAKEGVCLHGPAFKCKRLEQLKRSMMRRLKRADPYFFNWACCLTASWNEWVWPRGTQMYSLWTFRCFADVP